MDRTSFDDPYAGNILIDGLGPILTREEAYRALLYLPPPPRKPGEIPAHLRLHQLQGLRDLHIPSSEGSRIQQTVDMMVRQGYRYRDPRLAATWSQVGGEPIKHKTPRAPSRGALIVGHSGTGKTEAILRALNCYPEQVITHASFPNIEGPHRQMVWLSVDVPASGRSTDLAANLMTTWSIAMERATNAPYTRFKAILSRDRRDGLKMLDEWKQVALSHFLGILHLDEVQNFFKLATLRHRKGSKARQEAPELSIVEDQCLRWILTLLNTWEIPVIFSGTPDGAAALTQKRQSTGQRVGSSYHKLLPFDGPDHPEFREFLFKQLLRHQYVKHALPDSDGLRKMVFELTAGIPRLVIALWIAAHRVALERDDDTLRLEDFRHAALRYLGPVQNAVLALRSGDPAKMARFDDLVATDDGFWASVWSPQ